VNSCWTTCRSHL